MLGYCNIYNLAVKFKDIYWSKERGVATPPGSMELHPGFWRVKNKKIKCCHLLNKNKKNSPLCDVDHVIKHFSEKSQIFHTFFNKISLSISRNGLVGKRT